MKTYHGFDYNLKTFDKSDALNFILGHYVFMNLDERPETLQHLLITEAGLIVDQLEKCYKLRRSYEQSKASSFSTLKISLLTFGLSISVTGCIYFLYRAGVQASSTKAISLFALLAVISIILPVLLISRLIRYNQIMTEKRLTSIHNIEIKITSMMTFIGTKNVISVVEDRLNPSPQLCRHSKTIN